MAKGATALFEPTETAIVEAEDSARRYEHELSIAFSIQQRLSTVKLPDLDYAKIAAVTRASRDVGGDFFDVVKTEDGLVIVLADISGKGISAALLASTLQGMIYGLLTSRMPLIQIATTVNRFVVDQLLGERYATIVMLVLLPTGEVELVNCGHVCPVLISGETVARIQEGACLPVGLILDTEFASTRLQLRSGDRIVIVTDGVTEAEDASGDFFGDERLEGYCPLGFAALEEAVAAYRGQVSLADDTTIVELTYCLAAGSL